MSRVFTGGARGCGLAFARGLAEAGANVAIFDLIDPEECFHAIEKECAVRTAYYRVDVSSKESLENGFNQFQTDFGNALDVCVPCAGINRHLPFLEFTYEEHQKLLSVNVMGLYFTTQLAAKQMISNKTKHASIVLVASMASHIAVRDQLCSAYCGSKGAVRAMCPAIAKELAPYFPHLLEKWKMEAISGRVGEPEDIMGACVFLANNPVEAMTTVVIVGAGPSGLMLACNLIRYGIDVVLLDDRSNKTTTGKADGMQPKTIETFKQLRLADSLLRNAARVYDIAFWESTEDKPMRRTGRQVHYPAHLVGASDPYILLAHQGMLEDVMIQDIEARGTFIQRNSLFLSCSRLPGSKELDVTYEDLTTKRIKRIRADYLVGCDGARSKVRRFIPDALLEGEMTNASWGVLDGVIETDFPDLWSKVAVRSHTAGSILWIPRERNMTRLYVELSSTDGERVDKSLATPEYVMQRAKAAMQPFELQWKTIEWFGNYVVGQRVARHFSDPELQIFIAGDAGHCHSALAAQGANTSMHDSFNLAWKLNLVSRGLAQKSLLATYEEERRKIAYDLINFDVEHCKAFTKGDAALAKNFDDNIRFISGVGAEYSKSILTCISSQQEYPLRAHPGALMVSSKVTRYIDANPVDIQLDVPMLGQFRLYLFVPDVVASMHFVRELCEKLGSESFLYKMSSEAAHSYRDKQRRWTETDEYIIPHRYIDVSDILTYALITQSPKSSFEISCLPTTLQKSRWTLYLDDIDTDTCTAKWVGPLLKTQAAIVVVRPDGYVGLMRHYEIGQGRQAAQFVEDYFRGFISYLSD
ncbi:FAD binding domain-containing protein [Aspergillus ambiguus]|uniref:FAD binding domain-containing protein n=1 Tax=Aspergillus ambiguus TaxID=176160 RepID=UPI003CCC9223